METSPHELHSRFSTAGKLLAAERPAETAHFGGKREWSEHRRREVLETARLGKVLITECQERRGNVPRGHVWKLPQWWRCSSAPNTLTLIQAGCTQNAPQTCLQPTCLQPGQGATRTAREEDKASCPSPPLSPTHWTDGLIRYSLSLSPTFFELGIITNQHKRRLLRNVLVKVKWR